mmetsp:Transcript_12753/g.35346  ORF Transcript_12753/g.35346 Transcript_12753/m.35346 type:complete len:339 (+) Transcript_12753:61-1077(+)
MFRFTSILAFLWATPAVIAFTPPTHVAPRKTTLFCPSPLFGVNININAGPTEAESSVQATGSVQEVITDSQRTSFKLNDSQLKSAVNAYFGKAPNDAYLHSPTPWGDLYKTYHWPQVNTVTKPTSAQILGIVSKPVTLASKTFENKSSKKATFSGGITDQVSETTTSSWTTSNSLKIGQKFTYKVEFLGTGGGGETSLEYSHTWGQGGSESTSTTVGTSSGIQVVLDPGEKVEAVLSASRGTLKVRVFYESYLTGSTAINYNPTYKDHHFWALGISGVMSKGGVSNKITSSEDIEVGYYTNAVVKLIDPTTSEVKMLLNVADEDAVAVVESSKLLQAS